MRLVFMGTPEFARRSLVALVESEHEVVAVVTQPDRPKGRGYQLQASPVKLEAAGRGLPVFQPERVAEDAFVTVLRQLRPDAIIVVAFGQKIPPEILTLSPHGCINVHGSLLPRYRGAAPIQRAVINGDPVTGVCTMYMDEGWDTGDVILSRESEIGPDETAGEIHDRLATIGASLLVETITAIARGTAPRVPQDASQATYAPKIDREEGQLNWAAPSECLRNLVRGLNPSPGAYTWLGDSLLKVWEVRPAVGHQPGPDGTRPGEVVAFGESGPIVGTGDGSLTLTVVQPEGGRRMAGAEFARGHRLQTGVCLGQRGRG